MSFQNKDFWMSKAPGDMCDDGEIIHSNSSKIESKRSHQWFMDGAESESFPCKKLAVEVPHPNSLTALLNSNIYWGNSSSFHSVAGQFTERLFDIETPRTTNLFGLDPTFGLSISHPLVEPELAISYGGIRKVKVSQVNDDEDFISVSLGQAYSTVDNTNMISMVDTFNRGDSSLISIGEPYRDNNGSVSVGPSASKDNSSTTTMTQSFIKDDENSISLDAFNEQNNVLLMDHVFKKEVNDIRMSMSNPDNCGLSMRQSFGNGENNIISFGGLNDDADNIISSGRLVCNYESTRDALVSGVQVTACGDAISKKKEQKATKKASQNNFPTNVRSLLSTGMLDGVPVKYVAWSKEKELRGIIKGAAYLCGCQSCTFSKAINAYEFELHAGCKTKHPNNHIYFDNGKTIYGVVQELRNTPQNVLFEVIQTITGSPINQKSFRVWRDSFLAATRELQRIYGKDEGKIVS